MALIKQQDLCFAEQPSIYFVSLWRLVCCCSLIVTTERSGRKQSKMPSFLCFFFLLCKTYSLRAPYVHHKMITDENRQKNKLMLLHTNTRKSSFPRLFIFFCFHLSHLYRTYAYLLVYVNHLRERDTYLILHESTTKYYFMIGYSL